MSEISRIIEAWEEASGVELDDEQFDELGHAIADQYDEHGDFDIDQLLEHHGIAEPDDYEADYEDDEEPEQDSFDTELYQQDLSALQQKLGRRLTAAEHEDITNRLFSPRGDADDLTVAQAFEQAGDRFDMDSRQGRKAWMAERLADERSATAPDTSDREYDLDNRQDRLAFYSERLKGTEFEDTPAADAAE